MVKLEEERFSSTITIGLQKLFEFFSSFTRPFRELVSEWEHYQHSTETLKYQIEMRERKEPSTKTIFTELAKLYDTYGTPPDLSRITLEQELSSNYYIKKWTELLQPDFVLLEPSGDLLVIESKFNEHFDEALRETQQASAGKQAAAPLKSKPIYLELSELFGKSQFIGYEKTLLEESDILALIRGEEKVNELSEGEDGEILLNQTPFYAESGGQVGDTGQIRFEGELPEGIVEMQKQRGVQSSRPPAEAMVLDTYSPAQGLIVHKIKVEKGSLKVGDTVAAEVDVEKRDATRRNHTATHLMHAALREVLGTHVKQAGSVVAPTYLRFDFSHYQPLTNAEIEEIENLVNYHILRNELVQTDEMAIEEAMRSGAMALFGEKYGEKVRVLSIKGAEDIFSRELCGGTHVRATGDIGLFKIVSDESIASGVRRIRAVTGVDAFQRFRESEAIVDKLAGDLRSTRNELPAMIAKLQDDLKKTRREADELRMKIATGAVGGSTGNGDEARDVAGVKVMAREANGLDSAGMRQLSDTLLARIKSGVVVLGRSGDGKVSIIVRTSDDLSARVPAGKVIKELAPIVGGKGGGKADMAEGGGSLTEKLGEALEASYAVIEKLLS
jgi:alanyl-tRNA synthetase